LLGLVGLVCHTSSAASCEEAHFNFADRTPAFERLLQASISLPRFVHCYCYELHTLNCEIMAGEGTNVVISYDGSESSEYALECKYACLLYGTMYNMPVFVTQNVLCMAFLVLLSVGLAIFSTLFT
jgi:hypothetical protein